MPLLRLERPPFDHPATYVDHLQDAALPDDARVFLTTGHAQIEALEHHPAFFLVRALTPPKLLPPRHALVIARGPFELRGELELIDRHRLTHLVSKDSGGPDAKLRAADQRGLEIVLIRRPRKTGPSVATVDEALRWVQDGASSSPRRNSSAKPAPRMLIVASTPEKNARNELDPGCVQCPHRNSPSIGVRWCSRRVPACCGRVLPAVHLAVATAPVARERSAASRSRGASGSREAPAPPLVHRQHLVDEGLALDASPCTASVRAMQVQISRCSPGGASVSSTSVGTAIQMPPGRPSRTSSCTRSCDQSRCTNSRMR